MAYSKTKLKRNGDKTSPCFQSFLIGITNICLPGHASFSLESEPLDYNKKYFICKPQNSFGENGVLLVDIYSVSLWSWQCSWRSTFIMWLAVASNCIKISQMFRKLISDMLRRTVRLFSDVRNPENEIRLTSCQQLSVTLRFVFMWEKQYYLVSDRPRCLLFSLQLR